MQDVTRIYRFIGKIFSHPSMLHLGNSISRKKPYFHIIYFIVSVLGKFVLGNAALLAWSLLFYPHLRRPEREKVIFQLSLSLNNKRSLDRVNRVLKEAGVSDISFNGKRPGILGRLRLLLSFGAIWASAKALVKDGHQIPFIRIQQILGGASFVFYSRMISTIPPRIVCVANDHAPVCIALLEAARINGIPTVYVQHAPVAENFPPLDYDISVLFDQWSRDVYERAAEFHGLARQRGTVVILPPFNEPYRRPRLGSAPYRVGIALTLLFAEEALRQLLSELTTDCRVRQVLLRPHPRCRADLSGLTHYPNVVITDGRRDPGDFLNDVDLVVVANSGFAVEALHAGKVTLFKADLDTGVYDYYGFVRNRILPEYSPDVLSSPETFSGFFDEAWEARFSMLDGTVNTPAGQAEQALIHTFKKVLGESAAT